MAFSVITNHRMDLRVKLYLQQVPEQHPGGVAPGLEPLQPLLALVAAVGRGLGLATAHVLGESQVEHPSGFLESNQSHNITHHYSYI